ncbi:MAG: 2-phospho-L-lactate guanylyltransferase [Candidatus Thiodiazotropha endolucinida]
MSEIWALVPLKALAQVKKRLAPALTAELRRELVLAMAQDVVSALLGVDLITRVLLVTNESSATHSFTTMGADIFEPERLGELNPELEQAAAYAKSQGAEVVLIVHADLPLLTAMAVRDFIATASPAIPRAAACKAGAGTNLLLTGLPLQFPLVFGYDSLSGFRQKFTAHNKKMDVVMHPLLALDIDTPDDLQTLLSKIKKGELVGKATEELLLREAFDRDKIMMETKRWRFARTY